MNGVIPSLLPQDLEKILFLLPDPNRCIFKVRDPSRKVDYSDLYNQLHTNLPATNKVHFFPSDHILETSYLGKEILQSLYTSFYQDMEALVTGSGWDDKKVRIDLVEVNWSYRGKVPRDFENQWLASGGVWNMDIYITPHQVKISYEETKPLLAEKLEKLLKSSIVELTLEQLPKE